MTTESSSPAEIKKEINKDLNNLLNTEFSDDNYNLILRNLVKSIDFITSGIQDSVEIISSGKTAVNDVILQRIKEHCFCISTLCDTIDQKLNPDDFVVVSNLIYEQNRLREFGVAQCV